MKTQCLTSVMEVARLIRTKSDAAKLDGEVFSAGVLSPPSPPCTAGAVPCYMGFCPVTLDIVMGKP